MLLLGIFWQDFQKNIVIFQISTLTFSKTEFLNPAVTFGKAFAFSKGLGSTFSENPSPGPSLLFKLCYHSKFFLKIGVF